MLNEFNKSHHPQNPHLGLGGGSAGGGIENYGADDLYNMDDVWNDRQLERTFDRKPTKVKPRITLTLPVHSYL